MVDRQQRDAYAQVLRHFMAGQMTNDEYEKRVHQLWIELQPHSRDEDEAISAVYDAAWFLYDDIRTHRMKGRWALTPKQRSHIARWILFLQSGCEYEWPQRRLWFLFGCLLGILTLGLANLILTPLANRRDAAIGDVDVWPFIRRRDYEEVLKHPRLLAGCA